MIMMIIIKTRIDVRFMKGVFIHRRSLSRIQQWQKVDADMSFFKLQYKAIVALVVCEGLNVRIM